MTEHSIAIIKTAVCAILSVDAERAIARTSWSPHTRAKAELGVSAADYFALWNTIIDLAGPSVNLIALGKAMANGPIIPIFLAFASAPNLEEGLRRLARYKTLFGPTSLKITKPSGRLRFEVLSEYNDTPLPATIAFPIGVFVVEKARSHTARHIIPQSVTIPKDVVDMHLAAELFGVEVTTGASVVIEFSSADAQTPFISQNDSLWSDIERDLERQLNARGKSEPLRMQVETAIRALLNIGPSHVDAVCHQLGISRSTLQRKLKAENTQYQDILNDVRIGLAKRYLTKSALTSSEISILLGFHDSKSFYRAFRVWTGTTPEKYRESLGIV